MLTHLQRLEAESIHIMREVVAEAERPVMLYSVGKDSACMLHLARKAFYPAPPPFPLLHVDTTWKFQDMYALRERMAKETGMELLVFQNPEAKALGINPFDHGSQVHTDIWKTQGLKMALDQYGFDAAFGGARRDEEKSRAKERVFSFRTESHHWDPKNQRPELWRLYNARKHKGESIRAFPISNWTELDIWQYIQLENIPIVPLYYSAPRPRGRSRWHPHHGGRCAHATAPGRSADDQERALSHLGLLPTHGRGRIDCRHPARDHSRDAADDHIGAPRPHDRPRQRGVDGEEKTRGVFLIWHTFLI